MKRFIVVFALVFLATAGSASAQATRTWVSGVGDDANPCSRTAPCKTFAGAIAKTAVGGEIDALDPGGFGALTITKSITIDGGGGTAGVLVSGTNGIVVAIPPGGTDSQRRVVLRNLNINGLYTGLDGVRIVDARSVRVENSRIFGFSKNGVGFTPTGTGDMSLVLDRVTIGEMLGNGLSVAAAAPAQNLSVLVRDSTITGASGTGGGPPGETGIGISADTGAHVWLTGTSVFDNLIGLKTFARSGPAGVIDDYCDNQLGGNADDGIKPNRLCPVQTVTVPGPAPDPVIVKVPGDPVIKEVPAPVKCEVPALKGLTVAAAKRVLKAAHCTLGKVNRKAAKRRQAGKVVAQKTRPGKTLKKGAKVAVTVGRAT